VVAAGIYGVAFVSSNAVDWQPITIAGVPGNWMAQGHWLSLAFGDGVFVAVGIGGNHEGKLFSSINGSDWHAHEILPYPDSGSLPNVWNDAIIFGGAPWVAYSRDRFYSGVGPEYLWRSGRGVPRLHIPPHHPQQLSIRVAGVEDAVSRLQTSVDFMNWTDAGAVTNEPGGPLLLPINITEPQRFYRVISE
jgi:hypothetical protein